jgi:hypothetical protein
LTSILRFSTVLRAADSNIVTRRTAVLITTPLQLGFPGEGVHKNSQDNLKIVKLGGALAPISQLKKLRSAT